MPLLSQKSDIKLGWVKLEACVYCILERRHWAAILFLTGSSKALYNQSKRYCPVLDLQEGSALWGLAPALLHDQTWTITFRLIVPCGETSETKWRRPCYCTLNASLVYPGL